MTFMHRTFTVGSRGFRQLQRLSHCTAPSRAFTPSTSRRSNQLTPDQFAERRAKRVERNAIRQAANGNETRSVALFIEASVRFYTRHYVIVEPRNTDPKLWPAKLERTPDHFLSSYTQALVTMYDGDVTKVRASPLLVTAAIPYTESYSSTLEQKQGKELVDSGKQETHDLLVFPDAVRIHNVRLSQISMLVHEALEKAGDLTALLKREKMQSTHMKEGYHIMVCGHAARDVRCGCKGPELLQWLNASTFDKPLTLWISSHLGGHRFAATCIAYPTGDWFGLLNDPDKAKDMLDAINDEDPLRVYNLWRGRMGLTVQDMHRAVKERVGRAEDVASQA